MKPKTKNDGKLLIIIELLFGLAGGILFMRFAGSSENESLWGKTIGEGILKFYGTLSLLFFVIVFMIGIAGAFVNGKSHKIASATWFALLFWLLSLIVCIAIAEAGGIPAMFILLIAIVGGFNFGLRRSSNSEVRHPEI